MKKIVITLAALATISTAAFADGFNGSTLSKGSSVDNSTLTDSTDLNIVKKTKLYKSDVQSTGNTQEDGIGYLSKDPGVHDSLGAQ